MSKAKPVPDLDLLGRFAIAAARNARRLLEDAELLASRGRWPTAYSVAVLAFEEAGKAWLTVIAMMVPDSDRDEFPFGEMTSRHTWKLQAAHGMALMLAFFRGAPGAPDRMLPPEGALEIMAREYDMAKQRGLYADISEGRIWEPAHMTREQAKDAIVGVRSILDDGGFLTDPEFIAWLASIPAEIRPEVDAFWGKILVGWQQDSYDGMADAMQDAMTEMGALDRMADVLREQNANRSAIEAARRPRRAQPRKPLPRRRRTH